MKVLWTEKARTDLVSIARYIALDNPAAARKTVSLLRRQSRRLVEFSQGGRMVPEYERPELRELVIGSYRLVYRVVGDEVHILTVFESHRQMPLDPSEPILGG